MPSRGLLVERLVWALMVVVLAKGVEALLLLLSVGGRWTQCGIFECAAHAFVAAVFLGLSGADAFGGDAVFDPQDGQAREAKAGGTGEGYAVVRADNIGQTVLAEGLIELWNDALESCSGQIFAAQKVARVAIADR